jgi:hypothetical protein
MASFGVSQQAYSKVLPQHFLPAPGDRSLDTAQMLVVVPHDSRDW